MLSIDKRQSQKSFTLMEIMVIIAVIGILAAVFISRMPGASDRVNIAKGQAWSNSIRNSLTGGRVFEWNFDEGEGTTTADKTGTNTGTLINGPIWKSGSNCVSGSCLEFDGSNDYVSVPDVPSLEIAGNLTLSFWVKPDVLSNNFMPVATKNYSKEWLIAVDVRGTARAIAWRHGDGTVEYGTFDNVFTDGEIWYHIACSRTFSPKKLTCYKNGVKLGTVPYVKDITNGKTPLTIGSGYSYYYKGLIDEVRIYDSALPLSAIRKDYIAGLDQLLAEGQITKEDYRQRLTGLDPTYSVNE
jgi:hypothetical protein